MIVKINIQPSTTPTINKNVSWFKPKIVGWPLDDGLILFTEAFFLTVSDVINAGKNVNGGRVPSDAKNIRESQYARKKNNNPI